MIAGQENTVTMEYVNKGKGKAISINVEPHDGGRTPMHDGQYVGNVASGATGTIGYASTPTRQAS